MPFPRRSQSVSRTRGPKPRYVWVPGNDQAEVTGAASLESSDDLLANFFGDSGRETGPGMVIEKIFGTLIVESGTVNSLLPFMCGLQLFGEGGVGGGISPKTEIGRFLWFMQGECAIGADEVAAGVFIPKRETFQFVVKSRARLIDMGQELRLQMQNDSVDQSLTWSIYTRTLLRVT